MDKNKIFKLFSMNAPIGNLDDDDMEHFRETPRYKVGMFGKLVLNGVHFQEKLTDFLLKSNENLDADEIEDVGNFIMFNRAYFWIQEFEIEDEDWIEALNFYTDDTVSKALELTIAFFVSIEEYEKCKFLSDVRSKLGCP